jgi:hypothetical protein
MLKLFILLFLVATTAAYGQTLDVIGTGISITGGGLTATSTVDLTGARTSLGRSTGKWLFRGTVISTSTPDDAAVNFGFMSAGGAVTGAIPGNSGSPTNTGFSIGPRGHFIFSPRMYIWRLQSQGSYTLTYLPILSIAIDIDAKKFWFCTSDGSTDTGWQYGAGGGAPTADPTFSVGQSYATWITDSNTIYPHIYFQYSGFSGSVDFNPTGSLCAAPGFNGWGATPTQQRGVGYIYGTNDNDACTWDNPMGRAA